MECISERVADIVFCGDPFGEVETKKERQARVREQFAADLERRFGTKQPPKKIFGRFFRKRLASVSPMP